MNPIPPSAAANRFPKLHFRIKGLMLVTALIAGGLGIWRWWVSYRVHDGLHVGGYEEFTNFACYPILIDRPFQPVAIGIQIDQGPIQKVDVYSTNETRWCNIIIHEKAREQPGVMTIFGHGKPQNIPLGMNQKANLVLRPA